MTWPISENFDSQTPPALPATLTSYSGTWTTEAGVSVSGANGLKNTGTGGMKSANVDANSGNVSVYAYVRCPSAWPSSTTCNYAVYGRSAGGTLTGGSYAVLALCTSTSLCNLLLSKYNSGRTDFASVTISYVPPSTWLRIGIDCNGTSLRGWCQAQGTNLWLDPLGEWTPGPLTPDGTQPCFGTATDSTFTGAQLCGIWSDTSTGFYDDVNFQNSSAPATTSAYFPSNASYLTRTAWTEVQSYPFWVGAWVSSFRRMSLASGGYGTTFAAVSTTRLTGVINGFQLEVVGSRVQVRSGDGTINSGALSLSAPLTEPYWDHVLALHTSASSRKIYLNGVLETTDTTTINADLTAGTPTSRIGIGANAVTQPFLGAIANVTVGTGTPSGSDITNLATVGYNYSTVPNIAHLYTLSGNANDTVGTSHMTVVGTPVYQAWGPASVFPALTRAAYINQVFGSAGLPVDTPTVTTGVSNPLSNVSGYASIETLDVSYALPTNALASIAALAAVTTYTTRLWHFIATGTPTHVVFWDDGHGILSVLNDPTLGTGSGGAVAINALLAAGYSVVMSLPPGYCASDPFYSTGDGQTIHDYLKANYTPWFNPLSLWFHPLVTAMNNLASRYATRSVTGLSGGGWQAAKIACLDSRFNHAVVPVRGLLAHRRSVAVPDWEQLVWPHYWSNEALFPLAAQVGRLWMLSHPTDTTAFALADPILSNGVPGGGYQDATTYDTAFLSPVRAATGKDVKFFEDAGSSFHSWTTWATSNVILPALAAFPGPVSDTELSGGFSDMGF